MEAVRASRTRRLAGLGLAAAAALAVATVTALPATAEGEILGTNNPQVIEDSYIVVFTDRAVSAQGTQTLTTDLASKHDAKVDHTYQHALRGFAATMTETAARRLAAEPDVAYVEQNRTLRLTDTQPNPRAWGLDRIDQRNLPMDGSYSFPGPVPNVTAYVIDTGIYIYHEEFRGRVAWGTNTTGDDWDNDCHGHGTHVAGTLGGSTFGVAKRVQLVAVKVLDCHGEGTVATVVGGIDWVTGQHAAGAPAVANMSLGGGGTNAVLEDAVRNSIADGVVYAIASGNSNSDACDFTPARTPEAITVNASAYPYDENVDRRASFSNFGPCTDIFAPGELIVSAWRNQNTAVEILSGTSMATPHVAGAAALYLSANPTATPPAVATALFDAATPGLIPNPGAGSPNRLLFVGSDTPLPDCEAVTNDANVVIPDPGTAESPIVISGCSGNASTFSTIELRFEHDWPRQLAIDLVAPDGSVYNLRSPSYYTSDAGTADFVNLYPRDLSDEVANGTWVLRVQDDMPWYTGYVDSWTLNL